MQEESKNSEPGRRTGSDIVLTGATGFVGTVVLYAAVLFLVVLLVYLV